MGFIILVMENVPGNEKIKLAVLKRQVPVDPHLEIPLTAKLIEQGARRITYLLLDFRATYFKTERSHKNSIVAISDPHFENRLAGKILGQSRDIIPLKKAHQSLTGIGKGLPFLSETVVGRGPFLKGIILHMRYFPLIIPESPQVSIPRRQPGIFYRSLIK
jgi:hypothetical protein